MPADLDRALELDPAAAGGDVAGLDRADVHLLEVEVPSRGDADQVRVRLVGPADVALALDRRVLEDRQLGADRADEPGRAQLGCDLLGVGRPEVGAERVAQLELVEPVVAADQGEHHALVDDHRHRLDQGPGGDAQRARHLLDRGQSRRRHLARLVEGRRQLDRLRLGDRDLDVRRVARGQRDLVLAGRAGRHVVVGAGPAHHPDVGLDPIATRARSGRRSGRRPGRGAHSFGRAPRRRGRSCRSPSS